MALKKKEGCKNSLKEKGECRSPFSFGVFTASYFFINRRSPSSKEGTQTS